MGANIDWNRIISAGGPDPNIMAEVSFKMVFERMKDNKIEGQKEFPFHGTAVATAYESLKNKIKTIPAESSKTTWTILELSNKTVSYLFDPEGGYVLLKDQIVALLGFTGEPLIENDIPSTVKRHVDQLKSNLTEAEKHLEKIEKGITELLEFIEENLDLDISKTELKRIQFNQNMIKRDLGVCKMYVTDAQTELENVQKTAGAVSSLYAGGAVAVAIAGVCVAGAFFTSALAAKAVTAYKALKASAGVATVAVTFVSCKKILEKCGSYNKWLDKLKNEKLENRKH